MRRSPKITLPAILLCLGGCHALGGIPQTGMADRCADIMERAYPGAEIDILQREAAATSLTTIVARVEGVRRDLPPHAAASRFLAAECRFASGVLVGFRWTKGPL